VIALLTMEPAKVIRLKERGSLSVKSHADIVVFDLGAEWNYSAKDSKSKSKNSPFDAAPMLGRVQATICEGRIVYRA
jgi:dihydroorotase